MDNFGRKEVCDRRYQSKKTSISQPGIFPKLREEDELDKINCDYNFPSDLVLDVSEKENTHYRKVSKGSQTAI